MTLDATAPDVVGDPPSCARRGGPPFASPARFRVLLAALAVAVLGAVILAVSVGSVTVPLGTVWRVVAARAGLGDAVADPVHEQIVWELRVPRALLGLMAGAALALSGTAIQAVARNPLGDPYLLGIVPGAALGAVVVVVSGGGALGGVSLGAAAFVGASLAFVATFAMGREAGRWPPARLVLAGVAVGSACSAATFYLQTQATPNQVQRVLFWSLGSVAGAKWSQLALPAVVVAVAGAWLVLQARRLNVLALGDDEAATLGVDMRRFPFQVMAASALLAAVVVGVAGGIGFVGLVVPHLCRLLVGSDHRRVVPCAVLIGAVFLTGVDIVARVAQRPAELPLGVVTAAIGAPFLLWLMRSSARRAAA